MSEESLFHEALAKSPTERAAFLDTACAGQPELRAAVEELLAAHAALGDVLGRLASIDPDLTRDYTPPLPGATGVHEPKDTQPGYVIAGRYTLEQRLGEGGMGEVWVAQQTEPVKRKVALKLIKAGMDSRAVLQRFEAERQALALMDHPNIAKVLDGGVVGQVSNLSSETRQVGNLPHVGHPFFVMELVNGLPLHKFCDESRLTPKERLELFVPICQAVQHAHQKGIIHRDLKPSNILVTLIDGQPIPKVIDFGVAKATAGKLTDESFSTKFGTVVGTVEYMAPEQAGYAGEDIDTRADIYSLGVILYELLTGLRPFDSLRLRQAALTEIIRILKEEEPSKPSTRLSTDEALPSLAALRHTEPKKLMAMLRGELDWVVMKCLEKQRDRRYATANGLARDIERYLADEPVEARPPSFGYRAGKFLRRHKGSVMAACLVLFALLAGITVATWGWLEAREQEGLAKRAADAEAEQHKEAVLQKERALQEARKAREAEAETRSYSSFLIDAVLAVARPEGIQGGLGTNVTVIKALEVAEKNLPRYFAGKPKAEALARHSIGVTWRTLHRLDAAEKQLRLALAMRRQHLGPTHEDTDNTANSLAVTLAQLQRTAEAIALMEELLPRKDKRVRETVVFMANLASMYWENRQPDKALSLMAETWDLSKQLLGPHHEETLQCLGNYSSILQEMGKVQQAIPLAREVLHATTQRHGEDHLHTARCQYNLAVALKKTGQLPEALELVAKSVATREKKLSPGHPDWAFALALQAEILALCDRHEEAVAAYEKVLPSMERVLGLKHNNTLFAVIALGDEYSRRKNHTRAIELFLKYVQAVRDKKLKEQIILCEGLDRLSTQYLYVKKYSEAEPLLRESLNMRQQAEPGKPGTYLTQLKLGIALSGRDKMPEALPYLQESYPELKKSIAVLKPQHLEWLQVAVDILIQHFQTQGKPAEATHWETEREQLRTLQKK